MTREHTGKYRSLWAHLMSQPGTILDMRFAEIEQLLGVPLPPSSRTHLAHWYGYEGTAVGRAIRDAGWQATAVDLQSETVRFVRQP